MLNTILLISTDLGIRLEKKPFLSFENKVKSFENPRRVFWEGENENKEMKVKVKPAS